ACCRSPPTCRGASASRPWPTPRATRSPSGRRRRDTSSRGRSGALRDDGELEPEQVGDLAEARQLVPDAERDVVGRPLGAPRVEERPRAGGEADAGVRVADPEGRAGDRLAL